MGGITRITRMSGRPFKHERSYFVDRPPSQKRNDDRRVRRHELFLTTVPQGIDVRYTPWTPTWRATTR